MRRRSRKEVREKGDKRGKWAKEQKCIGTKAKICEEEEATRKSKVSEGKMERREEAEKGEKKLKLEEGMKRSKVRREDEDREEEGRYNKEMMRRRRRRGEERRWGRGVTKREKQEETGEKCRVTEGDT